MCRRTSSCARWLLRPLASASSARSRRAVAASRADCMRASTTAAAAASVRRRASSLSAASRRSRVRSTRAVARINVLLEWRRCLCARSISRPTRSRRWSSSLAGADGTASRLSAAASTTSTATRWRGERISVREPGAGGRTNTVSRQAIQVRRGRDDGTAGAGPLVGAAREGRQRPCAFGGRRGVGSACSGH